MRRFKLDTPPDIPKRLDDLENRINWLDMARFENIRAYDDADPPALIGVAAAISEGDGMNITRLTGAPMPRFELAPFLYYDFIVDAGGIGTHTTLTSAIADAITAAATRTIWIAASLSEATIDIGGLGSGQQIIIVASDRNRVTITAATSSDIFEQTSTGGAASGGLEFHNIGFSIPTANQAILFVNTAAEVREVLFDRCRFDNEYLLRQTGGSIGLGNINLRIRDCVGDLAGFYRVPTASSAAGPDLIAAFNNDLTLDNWWDGGTNEAIPDTAHIQGGSYTLGASSGITFPDIANRQHFQDLFLVFNAANALFTTGASSQSVDDLSFQNIVIEFGNSSGTFGDFGCNASVNFNDGLFLKNLFGYGSGTGTFLTVSSNWLNVHVGNLLANGFTTTYSGPAGVGEDHGLLSGLSDDDHTQYALLAGRSGGQTLIGGTASGDDLTLQSTSNATRGSIFLGSSGTFEFDEALAHLNVTGEVDLVHTAAENDEHALEIDVIAGGFDDIKAINIQYTTGALAAGEDDEAVLVDLDEDAASGGRFSAFEMLTTTTGGVKVEGLFAGAGVAPVEQLSGTFDDPDLATVEGVDKLTDLVNPATNVNIFETDTDVMIIGNVAKFEELEFILSTGSSGAGIKPKFEFSSGAGPAWTEFGPTDGTNGMRNTGIIVWEDSDIPTWVSVGGNFQIRITRQRSTLTTEPVCSFLQLAVTVEFSWNKDGDILANTLSAEDTNFQLGIVSSNPRITFDTNDYIEYNRTFDYFQFVTASGEECRITTTGQLQLGTGGSNAGILIGGDALLYRASANVWQTPDSLTIEGTLLVDTINEFTSAAGVTIENVTIKDGSIELHHGTDTISTDEIDAPTGGYVIAAAQTGTTDDLDGIGGGANGRVIVVRADAGDTITVKHNNAGGAAGQKILLNDNADLALVGNDEDNLFLMYDESLLSAAGAWFELTRAAFTSHVHDASVLTYTPAVDADWDGDADPGDVDDALDQLAERVDDLETVTLWWPTWVDVLALLTNQVDYALVRAGTAENILTTGAVPEDWVSTVECVFVIWCDATETIQADFAISSLAVGEAISSNRAITNGQTLAVVADTIREWDITSLLPTIAAGDYLGFNIPSDSDHIRAIGIRFTYLRT